jgi:hypothetical protein
MLSSNKQPQTNIIRYLARSSTFGHLEHATTYKSYIPKCSYIIIVINTKTTYKRRYVLSSTHCRNSFGSAILTSCIAHSILINFFGYTTNAPDGSIPRGYSRVFARLNPI